MGTLAALQGQPAAARRCKELTRHQAVACPGVQVGQQRGWEVLAQKEPHGGPASQAQHAPTDEDDGQGQRAKGGDERKVVGQHAGPICGLNGAQCQLVRLLRQHQAEGCGSCRASKAERAQPRGQLLGGQAPQQAQRRERTDKPAALSQRCNLPARAGAAASSRVVLPSGGLQSFHHTWCARAVPARADSSAASSTAGRARRRTGCCRHQHAAAIVHSRAAARKPKPMLMMSGCKLGDVELPHAEPRAMATTASMTAASPSSQYSCAGQPAQQEVKLQAQGWRAFITQAQSSCVRRGVRRLRQAVAAGLPLWGGERLQGVGHHTLVPPQLQRETHWPWWRFGWAPALCGAALGCTGAWQRLV